jgi:hypothetical protein
MGLLRKLRVLAGALVHKPFMPRPEKVKLDEEAKASDIEPRAREGLDSGARESDLIEGERVADLLAEQQREQAD